MKNRFIESVEVKVRILGSIRTILLAGIKTHLHWDFYLHIQYVCYTVGSSRCVFFTSSHRSYTTREDINNL